MYVCMYVQVEVLTTYELIFARAPKSGPGFSLVVRPVAQGNGVCVRKMCRVLYKVFLLVWISA